MLGAVIGDIVGSRYEYVNNKSKKFPFFGGGCHCTDDSVLTFAVAKAILMSSSDYSNLSQLAAEYLHEFGNLYSWKDYGMAFRRWLADDNPQNYCSYGNGAAMRISPVGFAANSIEEVKMMSKAVTEVTHNHPEGLKGAEATATAIFLARQGKSIAEIRQYIDANYYPMDMTVENLQKTYYFIASCQGTVPQAITAFLEATDFEDAIRNAISIGGDSDTVAAITGGIAEAYFGIPQDIREQALTYLDERTIRILQNFESKYPPKIAN